MKHRRQAKILEIIREKDIETQEELANELKSQGIDITQATVSRDIKELSLVKIMTNSGLSKYAYIGNTRNEISQKLIRVFAESVISIDYANNLIVIRTLSGSAHAAASAIDALDWDDIVGSIAGDDTIMVIIRDTKAVQKVIEGFRELIR